MLNNNKSGNLIQIPFLKHKGDSMKEFEKTLIQKVLNYKATDIFDLGIDKGETSRHDIFIDDIFFANSTISIWQTKGLPYPKNNQYIKFQNMIIEFELNFACFTNPYIDLYHYQFKRCI